LKLKYVPTDDCKAHFPTLTPGQVFEPQGDAKWFLDFGCFEVVEDDKKLKSKPKKKEGDE